MIPLDPNDGSRPSRLQLDRYAAGELTDAERVALEATLDDAARAHLAAVEAARAAVGPLDLAALRARARAVDSFPEPLPARANGVRWGPLLAVAALLLAGVVPFLLPSTGTVPEDYIGVRSAASLQVYHLDGGALHPYDGAAVGEGDVLGFRVRAAARGVVLLSVDGEGRVSVYWPERGEAPEPIPSDGALPGSVTLDGAPGPEVFVAVFDTPAGEARAHAEEAWSSGGADALLDWADRDPHVDAVRVERR